MSDDQARATTARLRVKLKSPRLACAVTHDMNLRPEGLQVIGLSGYRMTVPLGSESGAVAGVVGIEVGVVSGVFNLESSGVDAPDWRPRHEEH
jgi:hypothetical protein